MVEFQIDPLLLAATAESNCHDIRRFTPVIIVKNDVVITCEQCFNDSELNRSLGLSGALRLLLKIYSGPIPDFDFLLIIRRVLTFKRV